MNMYKTWKRLLVLNCFIVLCFCGVSWANFLSDRPEGLEIGFFGGIQGSLFDDQGGKLPGAHAAFNSNKFSRKASILVSNGDMLGPIYSTSQINGPDIINLMNLSGFEVMGVHPNDFSSGLEMLKTCAESASFPFVFSNAIFENQPVASCQSKILPYVKVTRENRTIMFISLISPEVKNQWPNWDPKIELADCDNTLNQLETHSKTASITVLFSTMKFSELQQIFLKYPWIDLAIQNTSPSESPALGISFEHRFTDGRSVFYGDSIDTLLGKIVVEKNEGEIKIHGEPLKPVEAIPASIFLREEIAKLVEKFRKAKPSNSSQLTSEELENLEPFILNSIRVEMKADVSMVDMSGLKLPAKNGSAFDKYLRSVDPVIDRVVLIDISGSSLYSLWKKVNSSNTLSQTIRFAGITVDNGIKINGRNLVETEKYRLVTSEFFSLGGFDLLPRGTGKVIKKTMLDCYESFIKKNSADDRKRIFQNYDNRTIYKRLGNLSFSVDKTDYSGSVERYTEGGGSAAVFGLMGTNYNVPQLIGAEYNQKKFSMNETISIDRPDSELNFTLKADSFSYNEWNLQDTMNFNSVYEIKNTKGEIHPFFELDYQTTTRPQKYGVAFPRFGTLLLGGIWRPRVPELKWYKPVEMYLCCGKLFRTRADEYISNEGYSFGFRFLRQIYSNWELSLKGDFWGSFDVNRVFGSDTEIELKMPVTRTISTLVKARRFSWKERPFGEAAIRNDLFFGLNFERNSRWF
ncbi:MAG: hypothetical protein HQM10_02345 [Candidatus Riflebacteria bacterium]|nr:hypothetical protein [Candidatus Riflebacteria bacterium]